MKKLLLSLLFTLSLAHIGVAQKVVVDLKLRIPHVKDSILSGNRNVINEYGKYLKTAKFRSPYSKNGLMGIWLLTESIDKENKKRWYFETCLDDRYKEATPVAFFYVENTLVLVYKGDKTHKKVYDPENHHLFVRDAEKLAGGQVYIRPPKQPWFVYFENMKEWHIQEVEVTGSPYFGLIAIFEPDGTVTYYPEA
jgi:hypothetical protein